MLPLMSTKVGWDYSQIKTFGGINIQSERNKGELLSCENMSSFDYPCLTTRKNRTKVFHTDRIINGTGAHETIFFTSYLPDANRIFLTTGGKEYEYTDYSASKDFSSVRRFAALGDELLIIPDNVIFSFSSKSFTKVSFSQSQNSTSAIQKFYKESINMTYLDSQAIDYVARLEHNRIYSRSTTYSASGTKTFYYSSFPSSLKVGDIITIKPSVYALSYDDADEYYSYVDSIQKGIVLKIKDIKTTSHQTPSGTVRESVELIFDDYSIDMLTFSSLYVRSFVITRTMPELKNICTFGNRIWATGGKTIYASKLGDASEWNDFSTDEFGTLPYASFASEASSGGNFTAIAPWGNHVYALKENSITRVFGQAPDEFTLSTKDSVGVPSDKEGCVASDGSGIFFIGADGLYEHSYDYTQKLSASLGVLTNGKSVAVGDGICYVLCSDEDKRCIYTYDIKRKIWHMQDAPANSFALMSFANKVYLCTQNDIYCIDDFPDAVGRCEELVAWSFRLIVDEKTICKKAYGRLGIKYSLAKNASFTVRAIYDQKTKGAVCGARHDEAQSHSSSVFLPIKRCDFLELEFSGRGDFTLKAIDIKFYRGSEM